MKQWEKKEKKDSKDFGGSRQRSSGSTWFAPGDVKTDKFLIDSKFTEKNSYSLNKQTLDKIYEEALFQDRIPMLSLDIAGTEVVVVFKEDFLNLISKV